MARKLEPGMAYDTKKLNKLFALLSILFLAVVFWVFLDDYIRPWKAVQMKAQEIKREKVSKQLDEASKSIDEKKLAELEAALSKGEKIVATRSDDIKQVNREIDTLNKLIKAETIHNGVLNSQVAALTFQYETAHAAHEHSADALFVKMRKAKKAFEESKDKLKDLGAKLKDSKSQINAFEKEVLAAQKEIADLTTKRDLLAKSKDQLAQDPIFFLRNAPFLDYLDPTLKIQQVVLNNITDDRYFQQVPKVDRCMTCHTFIDKPGYEDQANPFKTHRHCTQQKACRL